MRKQTLLAFTVFLALAGGAMWTLTRRPERGITRLNFSGLPQERVDRIVVSGADPVELTRKDGTWQLPGGKEADRDMVTGLISSVARIRTSDVVTEDPARFAELEVEGDKAHGVRLYAGREQLADLTVGGAAGAGTAVREGGRVYRAMNLYAGSFGHPVGQWRERRLLRDDLDKVVRLEVKLAGKAPYTLVRQDAGWALADPDAVTKPYRFDPQAADSLVNTLVNTRAQEVLDADPGAAVTHLAEGADTFVLTLRGEGEAQGPMRVVRLGAAKDEATLYAAVGGNDEVYLLPTYAGTSLRKGTDDLRAMTLTRAGATLDDVTAVNVRHGKDRFRVVRAESGWTLAPARGSRPGRELDKMQVDRRVHDVINARAVGFAADQAAAARSIRPGAREVELELKDGSKVGVAFGAAATEQPRTSYARGSADGEIYVVSDFLRDQMTAGADALEPKAPSPGGLPGGLDAAALSGLPPDVRAKLMESMRAGK